MLHINQQNRAGLGTISVFGLMAMSLALGGCQMKSFFDPSVVGRWQDEPVMLPILDSLDIIDEVNSAQIETSPILPKDLEPDTAEYTIGSGDLVSVSVFELMTENIETTHTRRVDPTGTLRLPTIGPVNAAERTPSEMEQVIIDIIEAKGFLQNPTVSVVVQESRHNTYSVIGETRLGETPSGTYAIPTNDYRLLDAMAVARGISGQVTKVYVIRRAKESGSDQGGGSAQAVEQLEEILKQPDEAAEAQTPEEPAAKPQASMVKKFERQGDRWVAVDVSDDAQPAPDIPASDHRVLEIPYDKLLAGDMRYNVVIRPGDIIRVPALAVGNVYVGGQVRSPGTFALPGEQQLTVKQLVFAANGFTDIAKPSRVELIRRVDPNHELTVRIDVKAMFDGRQPDIFLKPNDMINVGTDPLYTPLAVIRNGFRASYGFGFIYDRNFNTSNR